LLKRECELNDPLKEGMDPETQRKIILALIVLGAIANVVLWWYWFYTHGPSQWYIPGVVATRL